MIHHSQISALSHQIGDGIRILVGGARKVQGPGILVDSENEESGFKRAYRDAFTVNQLYKNSRCRPGHLAVVTGIRHVVFRSGMMIVHEDFYVAPSSYLCEFADPIRDTVIDHDQSGDRFLVDGARFHDLQDVAVKCNEFVNVSIHRAGEYHHCFRI